MNVLFYLYVHSHDHPMENIKDQEKKFLQEKISDIINVTKVQNKALLKVLDYMQKEKNLQEIDFGKNDSTAK